MAISCVIIMHGVQHSSTYAYLLGAGACLWAPPACLRGTAMAAAASSANGCDLGVAATLAGCVGTPGCSAAEEVRCRATGRLPSSTCLQCCHA